MARSVVLRRDAIVDNSYEVLRFSGWNLVDTHFGMMLEPQSISSIRAKHGNTEPDDELCVIDGLHYWDGRNPYFRDAVDRSIRLMGGWTLLGTRQKGYQNPVKSA